MKGNVIEHQGSNENVLRFYLQILELTGGYNRWILSLQWMYHCFVAARGDVPAQCVQ